MLYSQPKFQYPLARLDSERILVPTNDGRGRAAYHSRGNDGVDYEIPNMIRIFDSVVLGAV
jgi:hypothetical protein